MLITLLISQVNWYKFTGAQFNPWFHSSAIGLMCALRPDILILEIFRREISHTLCDGIEKYECRRLLKAYINPVFKQTNYL